MVSRRIVQDSDDDGSSSMGNVSPEKRKSIDMVEQSVFDNEYPEIIGEGVEDDKNESSETNARGENYGSTGSTERLSREITFAHKTLLDPSPDSVSAASLTNDRQTYQTSGTTEKRNAQSSPEKPKTSSINHSSGSHPSLTSSTPSKPKRRQTTSERKTARTYGSKHTIEVFGSIEDGWEDHDDSLLPRSGSGVVARRKGEKRTLSSSAKSQPEDLDMDLDTLDGIRKGKTNVQRRATAHDFSSSAANETGIIGKNATGAIFSLPDSSQADVLMSGNVQSGGSRPTAETCNMKELELQHFGSSIETSTSDSIAKAKERPSPKNIDPLLADEPMLSSLPMEHTVDEPESRVLPVEHEKRTEEPMAVDVKDKFSSYSELQVMTARKQSNSTHDEIALPPPAPMESSSPIRLEPPKKKRKRDMELPPNTPESDDITIGLPVEQYVPRPSRSRGSQAVDDLVVGIDYSKRPEAVAKAKTKRRKTAGDVPLYEETVVVGKSTQVVEADEVDRNDPYMQAENDQGADDNALTAQPSIAKDSTYDKLDPDPISLPDAPPDIPPKKKRGRPRKQPLDENPLEPSNLPLTKPDKQAEAPTIKPLNVKSKKSRRSKTAPTIPSSPLIIDSDTDNPSPQPSKATLTRLTSPAQSFLPALREKKDAANVVKDPSSPLKVDEEERGVEKVVQESAVAGKGAAGERKVEAGGRADGRGPDKHSPLRKGRGGHRVGLSRNMRIPSLLKVVRK